MILWWHAADTLSLSPNQRPAHLVMWGTWIETSQPEPNAPCVFCEATGGRHTWNLRGVRKGPPHSSYKQMEQWQRNARQRTQRGASVEKEDVRRKSSFKCCFLLLLVFLPHCLWDLISCTVLTLHINSLKTTAFFLTAESTQSQPSLRF